MCRHTEMASTARVLAISGMFVRRCPTLPHRSQCSTIGAEGLSFRVRNVTGRFPLRYNRRNLLELLEVTDLLFTCQPSTLIHDSGSCRVCSGWCVVPELHSGRVASLWYQVIGLLVPVSSTHYCASTSGLSTQSSSWEPLQEILMEASS